ncbi:hypothetical protein [Paenibacillus sp. 1P07SE]|uniref:hypothetical protein n=1 Tax=Paenibacillus sp. 1P07SE TaxID=3132209 RepID=UPI0039A5D199
MKPKLQEESPVRSVSPSMEELQLIRDSVLLPMLLTIVDRNAREVEHSGYAIRRVYVAASQVLMNRIHTDLASTRKELRQRRIKVFEDEQIDGVLYYRFVCRGYEDRFGLMRDLARREISSRIGRYIREIFDPPGRPGQGTSD